MARLRSANYEDIQLGILAKAAELFGTKGYERSSITDLTETCGLSRGALYHYFDSKEALLFVMLDAHVRGLLTRLETAVAEGGMPVAQIARAIEVVVHYNAGSPHEQVILLNDLASLAPREQAVIVQLQQQIVDLVADILMRLDHGGKITRSTRKVYTMMLFGIINYAHTWYDPAAGVKPAQLARMATELFLSGVRGAAVTAKAPLDVKVVTPLRRRSGQR